MPDDNQIQIEIGLRDSISSGLRQIGREIDKITKQMKESGAAGDEAFAKFGKGAKDAKDASDKAKDAVGGLHGFMIGMSRFMLGATGVAAGFIAVGEALGRFAQKRVQMEMLSIDLRMSNEQISVMRRALERMGADVGTQDRLLGTLGTKLHEVFTAGYYSPLIEHLSKMGGEGGTIAKLVESTKSGGDFFEATKIMLDRADEIKKRFGADSPQLKEFADAMGWPVSYLQGMNKGMAEVKSSYISTYEISKESLDSFREVEDAWKDMLTRVQEISMNVLIGMNKGFKDWLDRMKSTIDSIGESPAQGGKRGPGITGPKQMGTFGLEDEGALPPNKTLNSYVIEGMKEEDKKTNRLLGDIADTLQTFERFGGGGFGSGGGGGTTGGGGGDGSGRVASLGPSGSGGGGAPPSVRSSMRQIGRTSARVSQAQSHHAPIQTEQPITGTEQPMPAGTTSKSAANVRYNNPGAMYPGRAAQMFGTTGTGIIGGGHKIANFPTATHGAAANMMNLALNYKGMKVGDALRKWSGGSRGAPAGYDKDQVITDELLQDKRFMTGFMKAITGGEARGRYPMSEEHWSQAYQMYRQGGPGDLAGGGGRGGSGGVASGGTATSAAVRGAVGNVNELQGNAGIRRGALSSETRSYLDYASSKTGLGVDIVSGGQPASGPNRTGSHRHDLGGAGDLKLFETVDGKKRYLDMRNPADAARMEEFTAHSVHAGATGVGAGLGYMGPNTIHIGGGKSATWGGADWIATAHRRGTEMKDRAAVDSSNRGRGAKKGSVKAEVDFANLPAATKKSGDELGKFKLLKITPSPQGAKDHEGLMTPGDLAHTPYVP